MVCPDSEESKTIKETGGRSELHTTIWFDGEFYSEWFLCKVGEGSLIQNPQHCERSLSYYLPV